MMLFMDIETLPDQTPGARDAYIANAIANFRAPSTLTKEQAAKDLGLTDASEIKFTSKDAMIARWQEEMAATKADEVGDANWRKTSFDGMYGSIACICYAFDDGPVSYVSIRKEDSGKEKTMLQAFYSHIHKEIGIDYVGGSVDQSLIVCGQNIAGFDLPFLKKRSIIHSVKPLKTILKAMNARPWDACIADTMLMWDAKNMVGMDKLCKAFGLEGKGDMDGSMVADTWLTDPQKVIDYCKDDVRRTRAMWERMTFFCADEMRAEA